MADCAQPQGQGKLLIGINQKRIKPGKECNSYIFPGLFASPKKSSFSLAKRPQKWGRQQNRPKNETNDTPRATNHPPNGTILYPSFHKECRTFVMSKKKGYKMKIRAKLHSDSRRTLLPSRPREGHDA
jgi:hypothetical protein